MFYRPNTVVVRQRRMKTNGHYVSSIHKFSLGFWIVVNHFNKNIFGTFFIWCTASKWIYMSTKLIIDRKPLKFVNILHWYRNFKQFYYYIIRSRIMPWHSFSFLFQNLQNYCKRIVYYASSTSCSKVIHVS